MIIDQEFPIRCIVTNTGMPLGYFEKIDTEARTAWSRIDLTRSNKYVADGRVEPSISGPFDKDGNRIEAYAHVLFDEFFYDKEDAEKHPGAARRLPGYAEPLDFSTLSPGWKVSTCH